MVYAGQGVKAEHQPDGTLRSIGDVLYIRKPSMESVTSSTSVQDDDDLTFDLEIGSYEARIYFHVSAAEAGDFKVAHTFSGTATVARSCFGPDVGMTDRENTNAIFRGVTYTSEQSYGIDATGSTVAHEAMVIEVAAAGTWNVRWAQVASSGTATTVTTASRIIVTRIA